MIDHGRVSDLFLRACALPPEAVSAFLDVECADDAELRAEVEGMLAQDARAGATNAFAARVLGAARSRTADAKRPVMPDRIGPYRILERLGEGGMGVVYRAEQTDPVRREVALKVIRGGVDSASVLARFEVERQVVASMDHPNIARMFDAGSDSEGRPYFVMERIEGVPITDHCRDRKLSARDRLHLFLDVCKAVRHAHRRGVIHRDLKPSNLLVTDEAGTAVPKVIDFSIAKALEGPGLGTEFRTRTGQVVGTLEYMSPEQATGRIEFMDTRSDVYALGVVLHELMTDRLPHDLQGLSLPEAVRRIVEEPPRSLRGTKVTTTTVPSRLDSDLATIVGKCLEKEPDRRYGGAGELAEDIERYLSSRPILARRPSAAYQLRKLVGRHRVLFGVVSLVVMFLVIFSVTVTVQLAIQRREHARADAQARKAERVSQFIQGSLGTALLHFGRKVTVMSALDASLREIERNTIDDPESNAEVRLLVGSAYGYIGESATAIKLHREAVALLERHLGRENPTTLGAMQTLGTDFYYDGQLEEASRLVGTVLEAQERALPLNSVELVSTLSLLGSIEKQRRHLAAAESIFRREIPLHEPGTFLVVDHNLANVLLMEGRLGESRQFLDQVLALKNQGGDVVMLAFDLANLTCEQGRHAEAEKHYREAVEGERRLNGPESPRPANLLIGLGRCLGHLRRYDEAERTLLEAASVQATRKSRRLPLDVLASGELAALYLDQHDPARARPFAEQVLADDREQFGDESYVVARDWARLGKVLEACGESKRAEEAYRRSLAIRERVLPTDDLDVGRGLCSLAGFLSRLGRFEEAAPLHARGLAILEKGYDIPTPALAASKGEWASSLDGLERYAEGDTVREEALRITRGTLGDDHPAVARLLQDRAVSLRRRRRLDEALDVAQEAVARRRRVLGPTDPELAASLLELARIDAARSDFDRARSAAREAVGIWSKAPHVDGKDLSAARQLGEDPRRVDAAQREKDMIR